MKKLVSDCRMRFATVYFIFNYKNLLTKILSFALCFWKKILIYVIK